MLVLQEINLYWTKEFRGAPYSTARNQMDCAVNLPKNYHDYSIYPNRQHFLTLSQRKSGWETWVDRLWYLEEGKNIKSQNVQLLPEKEDYQLIFKYTYGIGQPTRRFKDRKFKESFDPKQDAINNLLVEPFGILKKGDYARVICNGRHTDMDGNWYYTKSILNILYAEQDLVPLDVLVKTQPNILYEQQAILF